MNPRAVAATILARVIHDRQSLTDELRRNPALLNEGHSRGQKSGQDRVQNASLIQELCYGVLRFQARLELWLTRLLDKPLKGKDADIHALILLGLYQLDLMRVPDHAAVSETVAAVRDLKKPWAKNLVNAVLRNFLRQAETLKRSETYAVEDQEVLQYAHPRWLIQQMQQAWPQQWQDILQANNQHAPMTLRVNQRQQDRQAYHKQLQQHAIEAVLGRHARTAIQLLKACNVEQLPGFAAGQVSVQDEAAQLAAELLDAQPGQRVLDVCAAPGGKTCHILEAQTALQELVAIDIDPRRVERIQENLERLHLSATVVCADASSTDTWWDGKPFDRILLDAPCSATGVIRRHPDIKVLRQPGDVAALVRTQQQILRSIWPLLTPGGMLLYATCSVLPQENSDQIQVFLDQAQDAVHCPITQSWGMAATIGRQILPGSDNMDGFYYALIKKAESETQ